MWIFKDTLILTSKYMYEFSMTLHVVKCILISSLFEPKRNPDEWFLFITKLLKILLPNCFDLDTIFIFSFYIPEKSQDVYDMILGCMSQLCLECLYKLDNHFL